MSLPIVVILDNNPDVLKTIETDLTKHYGDKYRLMFVETCTDALQVLKGLRDTGETVAMHLQRPEHAEYVRRGVFKRSAGNFP